VDRGACIDDRMYTDPALRLDYGSSKNDCPFTESNRFVHVRTRVNGCTPDYAITERLNKRLTASIITYCENHANIAKAADCFDRSEDRYTHYGHSCLLRVVVEGSGHLITRFA